MEVLKQFLLLLFVVPVAVYSKQVKQLKPRIVNGEVVENGYPYVASLNTHLGSFQIVLCVGSIISPNWILTGAACTSESKYINVYLGGRRYYKDEPDLKVYPKDIFEHPQFSESPIYDIALLRVPNLNENFYGSVKYLELPRRSYRQQKFHGKNGTYFGWGLNNASNTDNMSEQLRFANVEVADDAKCQEQWPSDKYSPAMHLCGVFNDENVPCFGDAGAPLVLNAFSNSPLMIGLLSFGRGSCKAYFPSAFVNLTKCTPFIYHVTKLDLY